jgi:lipopolysaccharide exporter
MKNRIDPFPTGDLLEPGLSLSQRAFRGGVWVFLLRIVQQLFNLARLIILARILAPHDFGLMGIALLTMATLETFSQTGFQAALIQKKENIRSYLDAAWTVLILRGLILLAIFYLIAPYAAVFFDSPEAKPIIRVIGLSVLLQAFTNIGVVYFHKEMEFNKEFKYQLSGTLADFMVAVSAVLILQNVWAIIFGLLAGNAARCVMSYLIHPYRPRFSWDLGKVKKLFGFGKWILGSSILVFLITQGDDILVGKLLGATALGFYQLAYRISNMPATEITHVISQVTFPAYSKLQDDIPKLREAYLKVLQVTAFLSFPITGLIFVLASDFTGIFLGEKWMPMVPAMQVLCIFGLLRAFNATTGPIFQAIGNPSILTKISLTQLIFLAVIIYPFTIKGNLVGVAWAVTFANFLCFILAFQQVLKITKESKKNIVSVMFPSVLLTISIMCLIYSFKIIMLDKVPLFITFILSVLISLVIYLIYARVLGFSFSSFLDSGTLFKKSIGIRIWEK